ncbi:hypothetical protein SAMN05216349_1395 [Oribacterium sp. KHPX15]|nr:hypothetical protein SAMN05216349_1395 [Oribacterium sp. KHPX15]
MYKKNQFDVPVEFKLLNVKDHNTSSPVIIGTDEYIAAKVSRCNNFELGYGYSFEAFCLFAESLGIGTVILAASISRSAFGCISWNRRKSRARAKEHLSGRLHAENLYPYSHKIINCV